MPSYSVEGTVWDDQDDDGEQDPEGEAGIVPGVMIIWEINRGGNWEFVDSYTTDEFSNFWFMFADLEEDPADCRLRAVAPEGMHISTENPFLFQVDSFISTASNNFGVAPGAAQPECFRPNFSSWVHKV
jgi:hypothetical protein